MLKTHSFSLLLFIGSFTFNGFTQEILFPSNNNYLKDVESYNISPDSKGGLFFVDDKYLCYIPSLVSSVEEIKKAKDIANGYFHFVNENDNYIQMYQKYNEEKRTVTIDIINSSLELISTKSIQEFSKPELSQWKNRYILSKDKKKILNTNLIYYNDKYKGENGNTSKRGKYELYYSLSTTTGELLNSGLINIEPNSSNQRNINNSITLLENDNFHFNVSGIVHTHDVKKNETVALNVEIEKPIENYRIVSDKKNTYLIGTYKEDKKVKGLAILQLSENNEIIEKQSYLELQDLFVSQFNWKQFPKGSRYESPKEWFNIKYLTVIDGEFNILLEGEAIKTSSSSSSTTTNINMHIINCTIDEIIETKIIPLIGYNLGVDDVVNSNNKISFTFYDLAENYDLKYNYSPAIKQPGLQYKNYICYYSYDLIDGTETRKRIDITKMPEGKEYKEKASYISIHLSKKVGENKYLAVLKKYGVASLKYKYFGYLKLD